MSLSLEHQLNRIIATNYPPRIACKFCIICTAILTEIKADPSHAVQILQQHSGPNVASFEPKRAVYNLPGQTGCKYCSVHKPELAINVNTRKCEKCLIRVANFDYPGSFRRIRCAVCKEHGMVNVITN